MRDLLAGFTNYKNQSLIEMRQDLSDIYYECEKIKKIESELVKVKSPDLITVYKEILLLADKLIELYKDTNHELKDKQPSLFLIESLIDIGNAIKKLNIEIGQTWHKNPQYDNHQQERLYSELRDYVVNLIDLSNMGYELKDRFYKNGKPIYKTKKKGFKDIKTIGDFINLLLDMVIKIFKPY